MLNIINIASAQEGLGNITGSIDNPELAKIQDNIYAVIINPILGLATAIAFVLFLYGIVRFLINRSTNPDETEKGKKHILWGGLALFMLLSIWSIFISLGTLLQSKVWFIK